MLSVLLVNEILLHPFNSFIHYAYVMFNAIEFICFIATYFNVLENVCLLEGAWSLSCFSVCEDVSKFGMLATDAFYHNVFWAVSVI